MNPYKGKRILIVEDSQLGAQMTADILKKHGFVTEIVMTGEEALDKFRCGRCPDLILMDIELGHGMDGAQVARAIQQLENVPVVFFAVHTEQETAKKIRSVAGYGYVLKGDDEHVLLSTVEMAFKLYEASAELRQREMILSAITDSAKDAIIMLDGQGNVTFWNPAAEHIFGYSRDEILGKNLHQLLIPAKSLEDNNKSPHNFQLTGLDKSAGNRMELKAKHKDGREVDVELSWSVLEIKDAGYAVGIVRDISERKRLEYEKRRQLDRCRLLLEGIPNPAWLVSRERFIIAQNKAAVELFQTKVGEYCWQSIHHGETLPPNYSEVIARSGTPLPSTKCFFCRGDEALDKNRSINREINIDGESWDTWWVPVDENAYLHYAVNITRFKKMEEEVRRREEFLRLLLDSVPAGIITVDALSGRLERVNLEAAAMIGATPEELKGRLCSEFFPSAGEYCPSTTSDQKTENAEQILRRLDGREIPVLKTIKRIQTDDGEKLIENFIDLTERKKMEEELKRLSITDSLTGAYNRRHFLEMLIQEIERVRRTGLPLALIMFDLDHFKSINDRFGHATGDLVLKSLVAAFKERLRKTDCLARWGGEEFVIFLPDTTEEGAARLAEELRLRLSQMEIPGVGRVTASFGVTVYSAGDTVDTITQKVDNMLYKAKESGRNCVYTCPRG
ncbi:diguanylate cyclase [Moorella naiadis]|uniref:diguanylate cyclase n=1 Tax=Moorella naiadis (nom. illeg.) TaxID=3093670 RepID=UPI003D9C8918